MQKIITGALLLSALVISPNTTDQNFKDKPASETNSDVDKPDGIEQVSKPEQPKVSELIDALIYVESRGNDSAIGDRHLGKPSVGCLQIRPIMVREVNRILKRKKKELRYTMDDRFSREKSIEMFMVWKDYYHDSDNFEEIARTWNGGPKGMKNKKTLSYWSKVKFELNKKDI